MIDFGSSCFEDERGAVVIQISQALGTADWFVQFVQFIRTSRADFTDLLKLSLACHMVSASTCGVLGVFSPNCTLVC